MNNERSTEHGDPSHPANPGRYATLICGWTALWNGDLDQAGVVCAPRMSIRFGGRLIAETGDQVTTPADLAELIRRFRASRPGLTYRVVEAKTASDWAYCIWDADLADLHVGGIDTFDIADGRISRVHSVTAERPMSRQPNEGRPPATPHVRMSP